MIVLGGVACAAGVQAVESGPVELTPSQLDGVVASAGAGVVTAAIAVGAFGFTQTMGVAMAEKTTGTPPLQTGYVAGSEGVATATAVGAGAAIGTAAMTAAEAAGTNVRMYNINHSLSGNITGVSGSAIMSFGSFATPLFSFQ